MIHKKKSKYAGKEVRIKSGLIHPYIKNFGGSKILIVDWWDRVSGYSWKLAQGNPACLIYAVRTGFTKTPPPTPDDDVLYGKIDHLGYLVHISEIEEEKWR
jgi:hypothetical protein